MPARVIFNERECRPKLKSGFFSSGLELERSGGRPKKKQDYAAPMKSGATGETKYPARPD